MLLMVLERDGNKEVNLAAQEAGHMDTLEKASPDLWGELVTDARKRDR